MLREDVPVKGASMCTCVSTSFGIAVEWPQFQVDPLHVFPQIRVLGELKATGYALKRSLLEVDGLVVSLQIAGPGECLVTIHIWAGVLLLRSGPLGASLDSCGGGLRPLPLLALG